jgi:hypothetical protein
MDTLGKIAQLREALRSDATLKQTEAWWDLYERLDAHVLVFDKHTSQYERETLNRLKNGLSLATRMIREQERNPNIHLAQLALTALESSIHRRTTGPDGWPLKG